MAITDAVRGPWSSSASSPTQVPGPMVATFFLLRRTSAVPLDDDEGLTADRALLAEGLAGREGDLVGRPRHRLQLLLRARREERDRCEVVEVRLASHGGAA